MKSLRKYINEALNEGKTKTISFENGQEAGGSKKELEQDYDGIKVKKWSKKETIITGPESVINDFIEDYGFDDPDMEYEVIEESVNEGKESWPKYLKLLGGYDASKFHKLDPNASKFYKAKYNAVTDANEFEQNFLDDLERDLNKIPLKDSLDENFKSSHDIDEVAYDTDGDPWRIVEKFKANDWPKYVDKTDYDKDITNSKGFKAIVHRNKTLVFASKYNAPKEGIFELITDLDKFDTKTGYHEFQLMSRVLVNN